MANPFSSLLLGGLALLAETAAPAPTAAGSFAAFAATAVAEERSEAGDLLVAEAPPLADLVAPAPAAIAPEAPLRAAPVRVLTEIGMVYVPRAFHPREDGTFDLVIHFHGTPGALEKALDSAGIDAVLVVVNLGLGSGPYEDRYQHEAALDVVLKVAERTLTRAHVMDAPRAGRIALSSWSAGYGAVWRLLMRDKVSARVDAVLLADGLHAAFKPGHRRDVDDAHMAPFLRFATLAAGGERLMAITHSQIDTCKYASTTETATYLERALDVAPAPLAEIGPRGMKKTSHVERGALTIDGYEGGTPTAHCDHLLALGETTFPALARRWQSR